jgi:hypothetical protein
VVHPAVIHPLLLLHGLPAVPAVQVVQEAPVVPEVPLAVLAAALVGPHHEASKDV